MKMAILELEYKNIRKITALKLPFTKADGSVISNNFIMMANGTGKTTTMELIKGLFDGTAAGWTASKVRSFAPTLTEADRGEFSITVKFDDRQYKYFLSMNYKDGTVQVETSAPPKGREAGLRLPESIRGIFTPEFVRRFVFDGEQAAKSMDSSSNEADETIRYLYRLDELDEILAANQRILTEIQNAEGKRGTSSSLSNLRTRQSDIDAIRAKLRARCEKLREEIAAFEAEKVEKEKQRQELDKSYEKLNQEKNDILKEQQMYRRLKTEGRIHEHPEMGHQLSDSMVRHIHSTLHAALKDAVQAHVIPRNPTEGTTAPKPNYKPKRILTRAELDAFLAVVEQDEVWRDFFQTELMTGLRRGEICGLQWSDFDGDAGTLKVCRTLHSQRKGEYTTGETKTNQRCAGAAPDQHAQDEEFRPQDRPATRRGGGAAGVQKDGRLSLDVPVPGEGGLPHYARRGTP